MKIALIFLSVVCAVYSLPSIVEPKDVAPTCCDDLLVEIRELIIKLKSQIIAAGSDPHCLNYVLELEQLIIDIEIRLSAGVLLCDDILEYLQDLIVKLKFLLTLDPKDPIWYRCICDLEQIITRLKANLSEPTSVQRTNNNCIDCFIEINQLLVQLNLRIIVEGSDPKCLNLLLQLQQLVIQINLRLTLNLLRCNNVLADLQELIVRIQAILVLAPGDPGWNTCCNDLLQFIINLKIKLNIF